MGTSVTERGLVSLNEVLYKLYSKDGTPGRVSIELLPQFPDKLITGDSSYDNERFVSKHILKDFRGGMGLEEWTTSKANRTYWHTCNVDHEGYCSLPPLVTSKTLPTLPSFTDGGMETWATPTDLTSWTETLNGTGAVAQGTGANAYAGTYSVYLYGGAAGDAAIDQDLAGFANALRGKVITVTVYIKAALSTGSGTIVVNDGVGSTTTNITNQASFTQFSVTRILDAAATKINVKIKAVNEAQIYADTAAVATVGAAMITPVEFDSELYFAMGSVLLRENAGDTLSVEGIFPATITAIVASHGPALYVFLGDTNQYWYMSTADVWTVTTTATVAGGLDATWGADNNSKLWKISSDGIIYHCDDPNRVDPTFTANGTLSSNGIGDNYIGNVKTGPDASGNIIIYVATRVGLFAHDTTNAKFVSTTCTVPYSLKNGCGLAYWNGYWWFSAGLRVLKYLPSTGDISEGGRDQDDGPPVWIGNTHYITAFIPGQFCMYVLMSGTYEGLQKINLNGSWHICQASSNGAKTGGIVSTVYTSRVWFNNDTSLFYVTEPSDNTRPGNITGYTYESGANYDGELYLPKFDAGDSGAAKLALSIDIRCSGMSATETITLYYQADPFTNVVFGAGWSALPAITANGVTSTSLGTSGVGVAFKSIWIGAALARGGTNTLSPVIHSITLRYLKNQSLKWGFSMVLDCREQYKGSSPRTLESALRTAAEAQTLIPFAYRDSGQDSSTPFYVKVTGIRALVESGQLVSGVYNISLLKP